jgi:ABC-type uncharacterized transport system permease subunit
VAESRFSFKEYLERIKTRKQEYIQATLEISLSAITGFLIAAIILYFIGYDPWEVLSILLGYGFSNLSYLGVRSAPLIMTGLAFSIPLLAGVFNIGGESQLYMGALLGLVTTYYTGSVALGLIAGFIGGALWAGLVAALRIYRNINEVVSAIMLNWIAYYTIIYIILVYIPSQTEPHLSIELPRSIMLSPSVTFTLAVIGALLAYFILYYTDIGYKIRVAGLNPRAAVYAGISPASAIMWSMLLGGGLAGYGGALIIVGSTGSIDTTMSTLYGLGFTGIGVGLLGRNNPIGIIFAAMFFAGLIIGGQWVELLTGAPPYLTDTITGIIVIALSIPYAYRLLMIYLSQRRGWK